MAIDLCSVRDVLRCNPSPDNEMFRSLVLRALLGIVESTAGVGVVLPQKSFAFGAVPASFATTSLLDSSKKLSRVNIDNTTDQDISVSLDGGTTTHFTVPANTVGFTRTIPGYVGATVNAVQYKYASAAPTVGNVVFDGSY